MTKEMIRKRLAYWARQTPEMRFAYQRDIAGLEHAHANFDQLAEDVAVAVEARH
jgi:hypothetical protein